MMWRNDPGMFATGPSVAQALVKSIAKFVTNSAQDTRDRSDMISIQLLTIANGPKHLTWWQKNPSETIVSLYAGPVKDDPKCLSGYIHAIAATLEAAIARERHPGLPDWRVLTYSRVARAIVPTSFFTDRLAFNYSRDHPDYRLPYVYSLVIALSCGIRGIEHDLLELLLLLRTSDGRKGDAAVERILDTNILVVTILRRGSRVLTEAELRGDYLDQVIQALEPLEGIIEDGETYSWRTRWKAIYLLADIRSVLPQAPTSLGELQPLFKATSRAAKTFIAEGVQDKPVPTDWRMKRDGLVLCGLKEEYSRIEGTEEVYSWRVPGYSWSVPGYSRGVPGDIADLPVLYLQQALQQALYVPYLSLYPQRTQYNLTPQARYRWLEKLHR